MIEISGITGINIMRFAAVIIFCLLSNRLFAQQEQAAIAWMQSSAEYQAVLLQTFKSASQKLTEFALRGQQTAMLEQLEQKNLSQLPIAILIDLDDTLVSTMAYRGELALDRDQHSQRLFQRWVDTEKAPLLPGVISLLQQAAKLNVRVLLISNRRCLAMPRDPCPAKTQALNMLKKVSLNFPREQMFFQQEYTDWKADQTSRRAFIASRYRVVMIVADDLNQMIPGIISLPAASRVKQLEQYQSLIGKHWFILPNPVYGSWRNNLPKQLDSVIQGY